MELTKRPKRTLRPEPLSFRFSEDAVRQLKVLAAVYNQKQVQIIEELLAKAFDTAKKKMPSDIKAAEANLKKNAKA